MDEECVVCGTELTLELEGYYCIDCGAVICDECYSGGVQSCTECDGEIIPRSYQEEEEE